MSATLSVSVVIATYNGEAYVEAQLRSILEQRTPPMEIVIGDDQSSDRTADIVSAIAKTARIPISLKVNEKRLGHADNFLCTASRVRGDVIALADQDDVWLPEKLTYATAALADPRVSMWMHDRTNVDERLSPIRTRRFHTGLAQHASRANPLHPLHGSRLVFRTDVVRYFPGEGRAVSVFGPRPAEHDEWVTCGAHVLGRIAWNRKPLILYRRHEAAVSPMAVPTMHQVLGGGDENRYESMLVAAESRAAYLFRRAEAPECEPVRDRILAAAERYRQLVPRLERRRAMRTAPHLVDRAGRLVRSVGRGDYGSPRRSGLGLFALLQDAYRLLPA